MQYFTDFKDIEDLRKQFHNRCVELHPDKGGDHAAFIRMKEEYDRLIQRAAAGEALGAAADNRQARYTFAGEQALAEAIERFARVPGIVLELCGSWLWCTGDTMPVHERLKALGARFSRKKTAWYFSPYMGTGKKYRPKFRDMQGVRDRFGSIIIDSQKESLLAA